jgi:hypothetical protein
LGERADSGSQSVEKSLLKGANKLTASCIAGANKLTARFVAQVYSLDYPIEIFWSKRPVSDDKVVPFRPRRPSGIELSVIVRMTRNWQPDVRQMMFPEHFKQPGKDALRR